jgi:hypothetical protein
VNARERHAVLDAIVASFLEANADKLPSTTTVLELIEWHHRTLVDQAPIAKAAVQCRRCGEFLSAVRVEMRLSTCGFCGHGSQRRG